MKTKLKNFLKQFAYIMGIVKDGVEQIFNFITLLFVLAAYAGSIFVTARVANAHPESVGMVWFVGISLAIMSILFTIVAWPMISDFVQHVSDMSMELKERRRNKI